MEATSAAKSSTFFSMPSPFSKRTHFYELDLAAQLLGKTPDVSPQRNPVLSLNNRQQEAAPPSS